MKRPTVTSIEQHVAREVIKYLEESDLEKKRLKLSISNLIDPYDIGLIHDCRACDVWFMEPPLMASICDGCGSITCCGKLGCKAKQNCAFCNVNLCPWCQHTCHMCPLVLCPACGEKFTVCNECKENDDDKYVIGYPEHPLEKGDLCKNHKK